MKRRWDDDVVFKNQARGTEDKRGKEFVNVRSSAFSVGCIADSCRIYCDLISTRDLWLVNRVIYLGGYMLTRV